jgi:hypothetical protein
MTAKEMEVVAGGLIDVIKHAIDPIKAHNQSLEQRIAELQQEIAALKSSAFLKDAGIWRHGAVYSPGDVVQFKGAPWICHRAHMANGSPDHACFRLWQKNKRHI